MAGEKSLAFMAVDHHRVRDFVVFEMDCILNYTVSNPDSDSLVFAPMVDFGKLEDPSIFDGF